MDRPIPCEEGSLTLQQGPSSCMQDFLLVEAHRIPYP